MTTGLLSAMLALLLMVLAVFSGPGPAHAQASAQAPTAPGAPAPPGAPGLPGAPGQQEPLGQPQEAVRPTPALAGAQIFDFFGFSFGEIGTLVPGYYVFPSFTVSETYDDNIDLTSSGRQDDFITRFTPGVRLGYVSTPLRILGGYTFDIEVYAKESDLNNVGDRQRADLEFRYLPNPLLVVSFDAGFARSNDPVDINRQAGLLRRRGAAPSSVPVSEIRRGREETTTLTVSPRVTYQFTPLWSGDAGYAFALTDTRGGDTGTSHTFSLGASRILSDKDTGSVGYSFSIFDTGGGDDTGRGDDTETSHSLTVGWTRRVTELLTVGLRAGPRFSDDGDVDVDAGATLSYQLGRLTYLSASYSRSQALVAGRDESATVDAVSAAVSTRPLERLVVSAGPSFTRASGTAGTGTSSSYGLDAGATYQFNRWLSGSAIYRFSYFEGGGGGAGGFNGDIFHNTVTIGLTVTQAIRVY